MKRIDKFPYPIGIEMTAIPASYNEKLHQRGVLSLAGYHDYPTDQLLDGLTYKIKKSLRKNQIKFYHCQQDGHCIEVASPKLYSWSETERWAKAVRKVFKQHDCHPKHPETVCGGCHVHVGSIKVDDKIKLLSDVIMRPYLPWVFGEPDDTNSMNNLCHRS